MSTILLELSKGLTQALVFLFQLPQLSPQPDILFLQAGIFSCETGKIGFELSKKHGHIPSKWRDDKGSKQKGGQNQTVFVHFPGNIATRMALKISDATQKFKIFMR